MNRKMIEYGIKLVEKIRETNNIAKLNGYLDALDGLFKSESARNIIMSGERLKNRWKK